LAFLIPGLAFGKQLLDGSLNNVTAIFVPGTLLFIVFGILILLWSIYYLHYPCTFHAASRSIISFGPLPL
jgi:hypothetical protein